ncbi:conjugative transfer protein TraQ (plasmid) [Campylobacter fetus subsp. venerealis 97/608]|uniref:TrbM/KikA/MpfK family conjugal transfer protein n=1 Tax=Campylobacter fetus TaxID=196 RepID=UPI0005092408|nr:TrbM/KikA/MpfK family conjugal transfer protein [Campylobacter fetus]AIR81563.1 conjugative transfer protein TraQ [Campylobacter fetus subsp. venerealis 97/608]
MKKIALLTIATIVALSANETAQEPKFVPDNLSGDTKLACEAILCLSSATRPSECAPSLSRYFSINAKKWSDTVRKRRNFLKLCPVDGADTKDQKFANLRDEVLPNIDVRKCTPAYLNSVIAKKSKRVSDDSNRGYHRVYYYRVSPELPNDCKIIMTHNYSNIRPKYVCDNSWYISSDWNSGFKHDEISLSEYNTLNAKNPSSVKAVDISDNSSNVFVSSLEKYRYYKLTPINKTCWVDENAK